MGRRHPVSTKKVKQLMGDWKVSQWECCVGQNMGIRIYANHGMQGSNMLSELFFDS
jgi:hypothetical protein